MDYKRILWTSLLILAAGIVLLCYKLPSLTLFVTCLGYLFLASSILNIAMQFARARRRDEGGNKGSASVVSMLSAIASGALGLWMVLSPAGFTTAMIYILGAMMILGGLFLMFTMSVGFRPVKFPFGFYVLPALVAICGIVMCVLSPDTTKDIIVTITAVTMIVFGVGALIEVAGLVAFRRTLAAQKVKPVEAEEPKVEDVTPVETETKSADESKAIEESHTETTA